MVWRLATFILYVSQHTKPLIDLFKEKKSNLSAQDFDILDDGFPPELGSV